MPTVQYKGEKERTVGGLVVYPGELLATTPSLLAAWQAEHGDVFVAVRGPEPVGTESAGAIVVEDGAAQTFDDVAAADQAAEQADAQTTPKAKRK